MGICIVTLSKDNVAELELTLRSVFWQSFAPARHLVVDSSSESHREEAEKVSKKYGAEFFWIEPEGIYQAMNNSLEFLDDGDYVLWLNSSDWFSGPLALEKTDFALSSSGHATQWGAGLLLRWSQRGTTVHRGQLQGRDFFRSLQLGLTSFPHPATIFSVRAVREVGVYSQPHVLKVASDYDLALKMMRRFGTPRAIPSFLSTHADGGYSSGRPLRSFLERLGSRIVRNPLHLVLAAVALAPFVLISAINRHFGRDRPSQTILANRDLIPGHFCATGDDKLWPRCCEDYLGVAEVNS